VDLKPGYQQTELGVIPEDWEVHELGELRPFVTSGSRGWADYYSQYGDLFVRITNLTRESIYLDLADCKFVKLPQNNSEGVRTQLCNNDVLISITADIGIIGYIDDNVPKPAYINQHIALVRLDPEVANARFVSYYLASVEPQKKFQASTDTGAKAGMSLAGVQKIKTLLPPTIEQSAIANALSDVDALLAVQDALIEKKRAITQGAMQELLTGNRRLPGFCGEWKVRSLLDSAHCLDNLRVPLNEAQRAAMQGDYPWWIKPRSAISLN
jgi:type I restriction enzyme S subunit